MQLHLKGLADLHPYLSNSKCLGKITLVLSVACLGLPMSGSVYSPVVPLGMEPRLPEESRARDRLFLPSPLQSPVNTLP